MDINKAMLSIKDCNSLTQIEFRSLISYFHINIDISLTRVDNKFIAHITAFIS